MKRIQIRFISLISENFFQAKRAHPSYEELLENPSFTPTPAPLAASKQSPYQMYAPKKSCQWPHQHPDTNPNKHTDTNPSWRTEYSMVCTPVLQQQCGKAETMQF